MLQQHAEGQNQRILLLADEVHSAERHRTNFRSYQDGSDGEPAGGLHRILDTLYFGPSKHSRLLQAADMLTFIRLRRMTSVEPDSRATKINETIWEHVEPMVVGEVKHEGPGLATGASADR
jgi:hypothetical protein